MGVATRVWRTLRTGWKRDVIGRPDCYQAYVSFPTDGTHSRAGPVANLVEQLEHVFEGSIDVYARSSGIAAVSDAVPADRFEPTAFQAVLDRMEECYGETHSLTSLEKWNVIDGSLVKSYVVVPVKPLFPRSDPDERNRVHAPAE